MTKNAKLLLSLFVVACGAVACYPGATSTSPSPSSSTSSSPSASALSTATNSQCPAVLTAPTFAPSTPSVSRNLAVVTIKNHNALSVEDVTDVAHPTMVGALDNVLLPVKFVGATEIAFLETDLHTHTFQLLRRGVSASSPAVAISGCYIPADFAWSPDGTRLVYLSSGLGTSQVTQVRLVSGGKDRVLTTLPFMPGSLPGSQANIERYDVKVLFSPNGAYISLVNAWAPAAIRIWTSDGKQVASFDPTFASWAVWSGDTLYFRTDAGIETWRSGKRSLLLPAVAWITPQASPAGGAIVYLTRDPTSTGHIELLDTGTGQVRELAVSRRGPFFLTSRYVWYQGDALCPPTAWCTGPPEYFYQNYRTPTSYVYDLQTNTESESLIDTVSDVWPHPA